MKVKVSTVSNLLLIPETDADAALLRVFADQDVHVAGSGGRVGDPMDFTVLIKFTPKLTKADE